MAVGVNIPRKLQVPLGAKIVGVPPFPPSEQSLARDGCAPMKSPVFPVKLIFEIVTAPDPVLVRTACFAALEVPTTVFTKFNEGISRDNVAVGTGAAPVTIDRKSNRL